MKLLIQLFIYLLLTSSLCASGSYPGKPGKPPKTPDVNRYQMGKAIFTGKKKLTKVDDSKKNAQTALLEKINKKLSSKVKRKYKIINLAGKMDDKQMDSLLYYLSVRYKIKGIK